jgi:hypothetical protein
MRPRNWMSRNASSSPLTSRWGKPNGNTLQEFEDFKEVVRRRADRITEQWQEEGTFPGRGQGTRPGRQGTRTPTRCYASSKGAFADPYALPIDEEELMEAAGRPLLTGWNEIAQAVGSVSVRTVQRWERTLGLPVGCAGRTAVADPEEIRKWKERHGSASGDRL